MLNADLTDEEREMVAKGADIVLQQLVFRDKYGRNNRFQPVHLQVVMPDAMPLLME